MELTAIVIRAVLDQLPALSLPRIFVESECVPTNDPLDTIDVHDIWVKYKTMEWRRPIAEARFQEALAGFPLYTEGDSCVLYGYRWRDVPKAEPDGFPWARLHALPVASLTNLLSLAKHLKIHPRKLDELRKADRKIYNACEVALGRTPKEWPR